MRGRDHARVRPGRAGSLVKLGRGSCGQVSQESRGCPGPGGAREGRGWPAAWSGGAQAGGVCEARGRVSSLCISRLVGDGLLWARWTCRAKLEAGGLTGHVSDAAGE